MEHIVIEGVDVNAFYNELNEKRAKIREGASKVISDNLDTAKTLTKQLIASQDVEEIKSLATQAYQALQNVEMVSEVSGVRFYLAYSSNYDDYEDILSYALDDNSNKLLRGLSEVRDLQNLFSNLEYQSGEWNTSFC